MLFSRNCMINIIILVYDVHSVVAAALCQDDEGSYYIMIAHVSRTFYRTDHLKSMTYCNCQCRCEFLPESSIGFGCG